MVLKSPIICHTKGVDNAGVLVEDGIQTDELVSVHLVVLSSASKVPVASNSLQDSVGKGIKHNKRDAPLNAEKSRSKQPTKPAVLCHKESFHLLTGKHFVEAELVFYKTILGPLDWISLYLQKVSDLRSV